MPDDFYSTATRPPASVRGKSLRTILLSAALAFAGGAALVGYLAWNGTLKMSDRDIAAMIGEPTPAAQTAAALPNAVPQPSPAPSASSAAVLAAGGVDNRVAALEQRLARLDLQAAAAEGNAARAEGLLVAFAARRAIERGAPLGYLADQLKLRFAAAQPAAVQTVIESAAMPVTLDQLAGGLDTMAQALAAAPKNEGGWQRLRREVSGLFVVRHDDTPLTSPENRLDRARMLLRTGQIDAAVDLIARMPGADAANEWATQARRFAAAQKALDLIETTALLDTDKLRGSTGQNVQQASPAGPSVAPAFTPEGTF
ncbi:hypothetical protein [Novosphingobium sp.]|uniref:hypothetical protein n=1 Tax=Novosphingobium sp. TaxID=1874826 RepID=UPI0025FDBF61|nr:hypothetical protein [Novosphingobium sp.]